MLGWRSAEGSAEAQGGAARVSLEEGGPEGISEADPLGDHWPPVS